MEENKDDVKIIEILDIAERTQASNSSSRPEELRGFKNIILGPEIQKQILEHRLQVQDDKYKNTWKSCCLVLDKRAVQYFTQIGIIGSVMAFSVVQLYTRSDQASQQSYMGLLTMMCGVLIPNPKFREST